MSREISIAVHALPKCDVLGTRLVGAAGIGAAVSPLPEQVLAWNGGDCETANFLMVLFLLAPHFAE
jgi:hypothetical protein